MLHSFTEILDFALAIKKPIVLGWANYYFDNPYVVYEVFRPSINYQYDNMFAVENGRMGKQKDGYLDLYL